MVCQRIKCKIAFEAAFIEHCVDAEVVGIGGSIIDAQQDARDVALGEFRHWSRADVHTSGEPVFESASPEDAEADRIRRLHGFVATR